MALQIRWLENYSPPNSLFHISPVLHYPLEISKSRHLGNPHRGQMSHTDSIGSLFLDRLDGVVTETVIIERRNYIVKVMAAIYEHTIHRFLRERGGSASKKEIYRALGDDVESRQMIDEKLRMMERFGFVAIDGEEVTTK